MGKTRAHKRAEARARAQITEMSMLACLANEDLHPLLIAHINDDVCQREAPCGCSDFDDDPSMCPAGEKQKFMFWLVSRKDFANALKTFKIVSCSLDFDAAPIAGVSNDGEHYPMTLMHYLSLRFDSSSECFELAQLLIESGKVDINNCSKWNDTALHRLFSDCQCTTDEKFDSTLKLCRLYLEAGADPNIKTIHYGGTALHTACQKYRFKPDIVKLLLKHGAKANELSVQRVAPRKPINGCETVYVPAPDQEERSYCAVTFALDGHYDGRFEDSVFEICEALIEAGADVNAPVTSKPLLDAFNWYPKCAKLLMEKGADVNGVSKGASGFLPASFGIIGRLQRLVKRNDCSSADVLLATDAFDMVLKLGLDLSAKHYAGSTFLEDVFGSMFVPRRFMKHVYDACVSSLATLTPRELSRNNMIDVKVLQPIIDKNVQLKVYKEMFGKDLLTGEQMAPPSFDHLECVICLDTLGGVGGAGQGGVCSIGCGHKFQSSFLIIPFSLPFFSLAGARAKREQKHCQKKSLFLPKVGAKVIP